MILLNFKMAAVLFTGGIAGITIYLGHIVVRQVTKLLIFIDNLSSSVTIYIDKKNWPSPNTTIHLLQLLEIIIPTTEPIHALI